MKQHQAANVHRLSWEWHPYKNFVTISFSTWSHTWVGSHGWLTCEVRGQDSVWGGCWQQAGAPCGSSVTGSSAPAAAHYSSGPAASSWCFTAGADTESKHQDAVVTLLHWLTAFVWRSNSREVSQIVCFILSNFIFIQLVVPGNIVGSGYSFGLISCLITPLTLLT